MARGAGFGRNTRGPGGSRRGAAPSSARDALPDVYQEMLADAVSSSPTGLGDEGRAVKRRRVGGRMITQGADASSNAQSDVASFAASNTEGEGSVVHTALRRQQTAYNDSDDSADSDMDWEEVNLKDGVKTDHPGGGSEDENQNLDIVLDGDALGPRKQAGPKRKLVSAAERKLRLEIHKMHLLSLLVHVHLRNHWCNDHAVQDILKKLVSKRTISYLNPDEDKSQFQRSRSFMDGLNQASELFKGRFKITARGSSRSFWAESSEAIADMKVPGDIDLPMQRPDFLEMSGKLEGSRDVGAQLFCALLRSAGVEARLICSLQALPFTTAAKSSTPLKPKPAYIMADQESRTATSEDESGADAGSDTSIRTTASSGKADASHLIKSRLATRLGRPPSSNSPASNIIVPPLPRQPRPKRIRESPYPVFWVEAFNAAVQKWVPVDPLVTNSIAKPSKFEPPASDLENNMNYAIGFEEDGSARDVTRRYTKAYNAKTRKGRVETTKGGERWWRRVMRMYKRSYDLDRDQVEDAELTAKEAAEEMPKNVQDFKDHPYYALERHLKRSEVIHPKRQVGKVTTGKPGSNGSKALEPIYRRRDVHMVKSADSLYRLGRELKPGEQPLKRVQPRRRREVNSDDDTSGEEDGAGTGMYAAFQTLPYEAPPVVNGRIPKNGYGNLDVYVPSMVPKGGIHIALPETAKAARILGIDYADAVTGFEFKGRHGTAVVKGAVVAVQYRDAVEEVIRGFEHERAEADEAYRSLKALRMWKRFMAGLRIRERIEGYDVEGARDAVHEGMDQVDKEMEDDDGGGFVPDQDEQVFSEPTVGRVFEALPMSYGDESGGFFAEASNDNDDRAYHGQDDISSNRPPVKTVPSDSADGGGFVADDDDEDAEEVLRNIEAGTHHGKDKVQLLHETHAHDQQIMPANVMDDDSGDSGDGGFIIDDPQDELQHLLQRTTTPDDFSAHHQLTIDELEEGKLLQELHESGQFLAVPNPEQAFYAQEQNAGLFHTEPYDTEASNKASSMRRLADDKVGSQAPGEPKELVSPMPEAKEAVAEDSAEDRGSLLSHDPSDEDAEPEWLV